MAERELLINKKRLTYEGLFNVLDLYNVINEWLEEKNYDKREITNTEKITPEGKYIEILLQPWKKISDYAKIEHRIRIIMADVKDVEVEKDGVKVMLNQGKLRFVFDTMITTDYENRWEGKPVYFLIRELFDKYIYKGVNELDKKQAITDFNQLYSLIRAYLNLYRY